MDLWLRIINKILVKLRRPFGTALRGSASIWGKYFLAEKIFGRKKFWSNLESTFIYLYAHDDVLSIVRWSGILFHKIHRFSIKLFRELIWYAHLACLAIRTFCHKSHTQISPFSLFHLPNWLWRRFFRLTYFLYMIAARG